MPSVLPWARSKRGASRLDRGVSRDRRSTSTFANAAINRGVAVPTGTVEWFNEHKRFGFITPDEAGKDL